MQARALNAFGWLLLACLAVSRVWAAERSYSETLALESGGELMIRLDVGDVTLMPGEPGEVRIRAEVRGRAAFVDDFKMTFSAEPGKAVITGERDEIKRSFWQNGRVKLEIEMPPACRLDVKTSGGNIRVGGVEGRCDLRTSGGNMKLQRIRGEVNARTSGGNIEASDCQGPVSLHTSGGHLTAARLQGDVEATTSGGDIELDGVDGRISARTSGGGIDMTLRGANRGIEAKTSGGSILLRAEPGFKGQLVARTSGGSIDCDFPVAVSGRINRSRLDGPINGGGPDVVLRTSGGSIVLRETAKATN